MNRLKNLFRNFSFHLLVFVLAAVLLCQPFAGPEAGRAAGVLFAYLFGAWGFLIVWLFLISRGCGSEDNQHPSPPEKEGDRV